MTWVLWDILVPLMTSFALGLLLGWLLWSWRRQFGHDDLVTGSAGSSAAVVGHMNYDSHPLTGNAELATDSAAIKDLETANITLIGERDKAVLDLETYQREADEMKARIAELEAGAASADKVESTEVESTEVESAENKSVTAESPVGLSPAGLSIALNDGGDAEELKRVKAAYCDLNDTIESERKARRATELELLNIKNRHEKLEQEITATIKVEQHDREIDRLKAEIATLNQQLQTHDGDTEERELNRHSSEEVASGEDVTAAVELSPDESLIEDSNGSTDHEGTVVDEDAADEGLNEQEPAQQPPATSLIASSAPNGYVPKGWSIPAALPPKGERDKLTIIKGVGPVLEKMLHECGIYSYQQVADLDDDGIEELQLQIPQFPGRIKRDKWIEQAKKLQSNKK